MRLFKKTAALVMVVMMLVTAMSSFTLASANAVVDKFEVKEFSVVCDATGSASLVASSNVAVNAQLQLADGEADATATVIAAVYSAKEVLDVKSSTKTYTAGTPVDNNISLAIPAGKTELKLRVFLWDGSLASIKPLADSSDNAKVTGISLNGINVPGFDVDKTSYSMKIPATDSNPNVDVLSTGLLKADVTYPSDGTVSVAALGKTYTITYTEVTPQITDIKYGNGTNTITSVMRQPDASLTSAGDTTKTYAVITGKSSPDISALATPAVADRKGSYFLDVPEALVGYNVIAGVTDPAGQNAAVTYTITVNSDTEILYPGNSVNYEITCTSDNSVSITPERDGREGINAISIVNVPDGWWDGTTLADYLKSSGGREKTMSGTVLYKATLTVPENAETATYTIKCATPMDYFPAFIMYKFVGYTPGAVQPPAPPVDPDPVVGEITNIMYNSKSNNTVTSVMRQPDASLTSAGDTTKTLAVITGKENPDISALATPAVADRKGSYFHTIPDAYVGYNVIVGENGTSGTANTAQTFTITINAPTEIYYTANNSTNAVTCDSDNGVTITPERIEEYGFSAINVPDGWWAGTTLSNYLSSRKYDMSGCRIFKATLTVPQGSATATYTVNCVNPATWFPAFMMYKFVNN